MLQVICRCCLCYNFHACFLLPTSWHSQKSVASPKADCRAIAELQTSCDSLREQTEGFQLDAGDEQQAVRARIEQSQLMS